MQNIRKTTFNFILGACLTLLCFSVSHAGVGISGTGRSFGFITTPDLLPQLDSILVNGIAYSTTTANITISGNSNQPTSSLKVGMAVLVDGVVNPDGLTGTAITVDYLGDIEGTVDAAPVINGASGSFTIYGIVIKTDSKTVFDDFSPGAPNGSIRGSAGLALLHAGDTVEVSGLANGNDSSFVATRIEKKASFRKADLRGYISNVTATTFKLGPTLIVDYSTAQVRDFPNSGPANGMYVEVKADLQPVAGVLTATRVSRESSVLATTNVRVGLLQGLAANVTATSATSTTFMMGNQIVVTDAQTIFTGFSASAPAVAASAPLSRAPSAFDVLKGGPAAVFAQMKLAAPAEYASLTAVTSSALVNGVEALATGPVVNGIMTAETVTVAAPPLALLAVQSRKLHGTAGTFDIAIDSAIPLSGAVTVEPRNNGVSHTIIFQFDGPVTSVGGVTAQNINAVAVGTATAQTSGNDVIVTLTGVPDNVRLTVALTDVNTVGNSASASIGFLEGDINSSHSVNSSDISGLKARSGQTVDSTNFKYDVNVSGSVNSSDISAVPVLEFRDFPQQIEVLAGRSGSELFAPRRRA
ncbi:MAG: DUF5666 domain-containing protein [Usitatibacteraceae bacterium]